MLVRAVRAARAEDLVCGETSSMPFKSIDLFSGIGGITYALREYFEPVLYCDNDRACQDVLARHVDTGSLPQARLVSDVRSIHKVDDAVRAIVGGSPCQSISCMGKRDGIAEGTKSGLFLEIVRIIDENPNIDIVLLENVANILRLGVREVVESLTERGFTLAWTIKHARGFGAPHRRERWFCLALRGKALEGDEFRRFQKKNVDFPEWSRATEPPRVMVKPQFGKDPNYHSNWSGRQKLLGNSVVPIVVRAAFEDLASRVGKWSALQDTLGEFGTHFTNWKPAVYPVYALISNDGCIMQLPSVVQDSERSYIPSTTLDVEGTLLRLKSWPTPRAGNTRATRLNSRSIGDLGSVLVHCFESQVYVASSGLRVCGPSDQRMCDLCVPNTACIEWCMGFPCGWTSKAYPEGQTRTVWPLDGLPEDTPVDDSEPDDASGDTGNVMIVNDSTGDAQLDDEDEAICSVVRTDGIAETMDLDDNKCVASLGNQIEIDLATTTRASI